MSATRSAAPDMPTLASAATSGEVLEALSRFLDWERHRGGRECPPHAILTDAGSLGCTPAEVWSVHQDWLARAEAEAGPHPLLEPVREWQRRQEESSREAREIAAWNEAIRKGWDELGIAEGPPSLATVTAILNQWPALADIDVVALGGSDDGEGISLEQAVELWRAIPEADRPPHPLAPALQKWQGLTADERLQFQGIASRRARMETIAAGRMSVSDLLGPAQRTWSDLSPEEQAAFNDEMQARLEAGLAIWHKAMRREGERLIAAIRGSAEARDVAGARPAAIDRNQTGIMPAYAARPLAPAAIVRADPDYLPASALAVYPPDRSGQFWIPGIPKEERDVAAFLLAILDAGSAKIPGPGAPLRDRYFAEGLMLAGREDRTDGGRFNLHQDDRPLTIADVVEWSGWNPKDYRPERENTGQALHRALSAVNSIKIPVLNRHGEWGWMHSVFYDAIEGLRLTDRIAASVRLWPGSEVGARVDRTLLRQAGKVSAIAWRLYLALCFEWNRIARNGRTPHLTQPEVMRDGRGRLLDADGNTLFGPDPSLPAARRKGIPSDRPATNWRDSRATDTGKREANPQGERLHRVYDGPADLVRLAFPLEGTKGAQWNPKRSQQQAVRAARWLAGERDADGSPVVLNRQPVIYPALRIERIGAITENNPDGFPWRIVPPLTQ